MNKKAGMRCVHMLHVYERHIESSRLDAGLKIEDPDVVCVCQHATNGARGE